MKTDTKLKSVEEIRARASEILNRHREAVERVDREIVAAAEEIRKAEEAKDKASKAHDDKAYIKACETLDTARRFKAIREGWKADTEKEELISKEEYLYLIQKAQKEIQDKAKVYQDYFIKIADETFDKSLELLEMINETERTLQLLQHDLYKDQDRTRDKDGRIINIISEIKRVDPKIWSIAEYGRQMAMNYFYKEVTGEYRK